MLIVRHHFSGEIVCFLMWQKVDPRVQQQRLDFLYAHYLQWLFLDSKATVMLQQQEKEAMVSQTFSRTFFYFLLV